MADAKVITDLSGAYRQPAERPRLLDSERRWFTRTGDVHKGPYSSKVLARSIRSGVLRRTSLVRAEDETEWRPVYAVDALKPALRPPLTPWTPDRADPRYEARGSYGGGFATGLLGGMLGLLLVFALAKDPDTRLGASVGCAVAFGAWLVLRGLLAHTR